MIIEICNRIKKIPKDSQSFSCCFKISINKFFKYASKLTEEIIQKSTLVIKYRIVSISLFMGIIRKKEKGKRSLLLLLLLFNNKIIKI